MALDDRSKKIDLTNWFDKIANAVGRHRQTLLSPDEAVEPFNDINYLVVGTVIKYYSAAHICDVKLDMGGLYTNVPILVYAGGVNNNKNNLGEETTNRDPIRGRRSPLREGDRVVIGYILGHNDCPMVLGCFYDYSKDYQEDLLNKNQEGEDKEILLNGIKIRATSDNKYIIEAKDGSVLIQIEDGQISLGDSGAVFRKLIDERILSQLEAWKATFNTHLHSGVTTGAGVSGIPTTTQSSITNANTNNAKAN